MTDYMPRLKAQYKTTICDALMGEFSYKNRMQLPKLDKIVLNIEEHIKSKCGVWPLITQPNATNPSNFFMFLLIAIGIS